MDQDEQLKQIFKRLNRFMLLMWRLGLGPVVNMAPKYGGRFMVIRHVGRKSGTVYHTPVNFAEVDGDIICTAGFGAKADWYRNMLATPEVELWLPDGRWAGIAQDVSDHPERLRYLRAALIGSGFASEAFAGVDPHTASDDELAEAAADYRLMKIRRTHAVTGPGGPGELTWVWPVVGVGLVVGILLMWRPRRELG